MTPTTRRVPTAAAKVRACVASAREAVGTLEPGMRVIGLTKGQFGQIDILQALVEQTGPADVTVSTWSTSLRDADTVAWLMGRNQIRSLQLLVDRSFPTRKSEWAQQIWERFGPEAIRCAYNHAKFILVRNERWNLCVRSSMNLNRNPRFEQFDMDDNAEICDFFAGHVEECFTLLPVQARAGKPDDAACAQALGASLGGTPEGEEPAWPAEFLRALAAAEYPLEPR